MASSRRPVTVHGRGDCGHDRRGRRPLRSGAIDAQILRRTGGAIAWDPVQDKVVLQEYLETVVRERKEWGDLYGAIREVM
jgi:hypothetical protein